MKAADRPIMGILVLAAILTSFGVDAEAPAYTTDFRPVSEFDIAEYRGHVILLNFWATWCVPCRAEVPELTQLRDALVEQKFEVIGISLDRGDGPQLQAKMERFTRRYGLDYPVFLDLDMQLVKQFGDFASIPMSFLIDSEGVIAKTYSGLVNFEDLSKDVRSLLVHSSHTDRRKTIP